MQSIIFTDISSWCLIIFAPCTVAGWVCIVVCIFNLCNWLHKYLWCSQAGRTENRVASKVWKCFFPILFCFVFYFISFYYYQWAAWRATLILASWGWWSVSSHHTKTNLCLPQGMNENKKKKKKKAFLLQSISSDSCVAFGAGRLLMGKEMSSVSWGHPEPLWDSCCTQGESETWNL